MPVVGRLTVGRAALTPGLQGQAGRGRRMALKPVQAGTLAAAVACRKFCLVCAWFHLGVAAAAPVTAAAQWLASGPGSVEALASLPFGWQGERLVVLKVTLGGGVRLDYAAGSSLPAKGQRFEALLLASSWTPPCTAELKFGAALVTCGVAEAPLGMLCRTLAVEVPDGVAGGVDAAPPVLTLSGSPGATLYLACTQPPGPLRPAETYPLLTAKLREWGENPLALRLWQEYATVLYPTGARHVEGLLAQVDLWRASGDASRAESGFAAALGALTELRPAATTELSEVGYDLNRTYGDILATYRAHSPVWDAKTPRVTDWLEAGAWPPHPRYRPLLLRALTSALTPSASQAAAGVVTQKAWATDLQEQARVLHLFARLFSAMGDRTSPRRARLAANQARLDEIATPCAVPALAQAFALLQNAQAQVSGNTHGPRGDVQAEAALWYEAETAGLRGDLAACSQAFRQIVERWPDAPLAPYAVLALAQWLHYSGRYQSAEKAYAEAQTFGSVVAEYAGLGLAEMAFGRGRYSDAFWRYRRLQDQSADPQMVQWLGYRRAQCLEFQRKPEEALALYEPVATARDPETAALAQMAVRRLGAPEGKPKPLAAWSTVAVYVGEDRATRGDWWTYYGSECFILCAQHCPADVSAGALPGWSVRGRTGDPRESLRRWVTGPSEAHDSFLRDPLTGSRRAANWDDRGEAYVRGSGPDLWLDVSIPRGEHRLSLYFVNDSNYYEPDRVYVVSVYRAGGSYQTGTEVRHFVNGVYQQFAVSGPADLQVRIERGLSLNVLLAGIFLDPLPVAPLPSCFGACPEWASARADHLSPADERAGLEVAAAARRLQGPPEALAGSFWELARVEATAGRYGPSYWAGRAAAALLESQPRALADHYRRLADLYLQPRRLTSPASSEAILPRPYAEEAGAQYLAVVLPGLTGVEARERCRAIARVEDGGKAFLGQAAYAELTRAHAGVALEDEDHLLLTCLSRDSVADIARIEAHRQGALGRPVAASLELALLGCYLRTNAPDRAAAVADRIRARNPTSPEAANAIYLMWDHFSRQQQAQAAEPYRQALLAQFAGSPWSQMASSTGNHKEGQ